MDWITIIACLLIVCWLCYELLAKRRNYPPGPMPLPFVGNLWYLMDKDRFAERVAAYGKQYGGVVTLWMPEPTVYVTDLELIKNSFGGQLNNALADRPDFGMDVLYFLFGGDYGIMGANATGSLWREHSRFFKNSFRKLGDGNNAFDGLIHRELDRLLDHIDGQRVNVDGRMTATLDPMMPLTLCVTNIAMDMTYSETCHYDNDPKFMQMLNLNNTTLLNRFDIALLMRFPWLKNVPFNGGFGHEELEQMKTDLYELFADSVQRCRVAFAANPDLPAENYVTAYLQEQRRRTLRGEDLGSFTDWQLHAMILDIWQPGMDSAGNCLRWMIAYLCKFPEMQNRVREELVTALGGARLTWSDKLRLPYLCAFLHEGMRMCNLLWEWPPHATSQDVTINGLLVRKGTTILPQMSSVLMDEHYFEQPEKFNPDRFLSKVDGSILTSETEKVVLFGVGKRICPAEGLGRQELFLIVGSLVQKYKMSFVLDDLKPEIKSIFQFLNRFPSTHEVIFESIN